MTKIDRARERKSPAARPDRPETGTPADLAACLAKIRREALARVTDQLNGRTPAPDAAASRFGDIRLSVGKAVKERTEIVLF